MFKKIVIFTLFILTCNVQLSAEPGDLISYTLLDYLTVEEIDSVFDQFPFNLFDRRAKAWMKRLRAARVMTFARSALLQGLVALSDAEVMQRLPAGAPVMATVREICAAHAIHPVSAALGFAAEKADADYLVVGVDSVQQLQDVSACMTAELPRALVSALEVGLHDIPADVTDPRRWEQHRG